MKSPNWISGTGLGERRVDHALGAELLVQAAGRAEHATELADVLAEHDGLGLGAHLQAQRVVHGLDDVHDGHVSYSVA